MGVQKKQQKTEIVDERKDEIEQNETKRMK